jgi:hypothetical protein
MQGKSAIDKRYEFPINDANETATEVGTIEIKNDIKRIRLLLFNLVSKSIFIYLDLLKFL